MRINDFLGKILLFIHKLFGTIVYIPIENGAEYPQSNEIYSG